MINVASVTRRNKTNKDRYSAQLKRYNDGIAQFKGTKKAAELEQEKDAFRRSVKALQIKQVVPISGTKPAMYNVVVQDTYTMQEDGIKLTDLITLIMTTNTFVTNISMISDTRMRDTISVLNTAGARSR